MTLLPAIIGSILVLVLFSKEIFATQPEKKDSPDEKLVKALAEYVMAQSPTKDT